MVVGANDHHSFSLRYSTGIRFILSTGALHIFPVLTMKISKEQQSVIAVVAGLLLFAWLRHNSILLIAAVIISIGFFLPAIGRAVHFLWHSMSEILGWISGHIILFILFYFFLTPLAFLRRMTGKKGMVKKFIGDRTSLFSDRNHVYTKEDFLNPW
jgi:hypothetical protein